MPSIDGITVGDAAEMAKTVTESDITLFAGVTGDFNPVHIDAVAATSVGGMAASEKGARG